MGVEDEKNGWGDHLRGCCREGQVLAVRGRQGYPTHIHICEAAKGSAICAS